MQADQPDRQQEEQPDELRVVLDHDRQRQGAEDERGDHADAGRVERRHEHPRPEDAVLPPQLHLHHVRPDGPGDVLAQLADQQHLRTSEHGHAWTQPVEDRDPAHRAAAESDEDEDEREHERLPRDQPQGRLDRSPLRDQVVHREPDHDHDEEVAEDGEDTGGYGLESVHTLSTLSSARRCLVSGGPVGQGGRFDLVLVVVDAPILGARD